MKASKVNLPSTLERSPAHAQHIYRQALVHAIDEYGDGERAHRTAIAALKREFEKVGDHWSRKKHRGPSDPRARSNVRFQGEDFGGVDFYGHTRRELYARARDLGIAGRSRMRKRELARAIARKQHSPRSRRARRDAQPLALRRSRVSSHHAPAHERAHGSRAAGDRARNAGVMG